jgi:dTDP-4-amino-4,6-dideoxygalactose transaminase
VLLPDGTDRGRVMSELRDAGTQSSIHYPPVHQFTYYQNRFPSVSLPITENFHAKALSLPLHPGLQESQVESVVNSIRWLV